MKPHDPQRLLSTLLLFLLALSACAMPQSAKPVTLHLLNLDTGQDTELLPPHASGNSNRSIRKSLIEIPLAVVVAEECYFRGMLYGSLQKCFSAKTALVATSLLFGLFHAQQGVRGVVSRTFTGWLWGSVRYSSGMIFLLIFPVHFAYNAVWLLFEGNWNNPPAWAIYALPAVEFLLGLAIVIWHDLQPTTKDKTI